MSTEVRNQTAAAIAETSAEYWTRHNVTLHRKFETVVESLDYIEWRNLQHPYYIDLMPVRGADGKVVLDYGCGPGHDLVGFATESPLARLIAMDVSSTSLAEARQRMELHGRNADFIRIKESDPRLPLDDGTIDLVHCSGVLHHTPDPVRILREFRRALRPSGYAQIMVYNYNSLWMHLYVAYHRMLVEKLYEGKTLRQAFTASTDGPDCPISECYTSEDFINMAARAGLRCELMGVAISSWEMKFLNQRWDALLDRRYPSECRKFLYELTLNDQGIPLYRGVVAGVDACYRCTPA
jgi:ubiquinone/menaquinone biosynthesis C-methylase UbiE